MRRLHAVLAAKMIGSMFVPVAFLIVLASPVLGQQPPPPGGGDRTDPAMARMRDMNEREIMLRGGLTLPQKAANPQQIQAAIEKIKQDFRRIQVIRNGMIDYLSVDRALNLKTVSEETEEIRKRAVRLQTNLPLYSADEDKTAQPTQVEFSDDHLKDGLVKLCNLIFKFTTNPLFKNPGAVDLKQSASANRDLKTIIDLSGNLRKSAERLSKTATRP